MTLPRYTLVYRPGEKKRLREAEPVVETSLDDADLELLAGGLGGSSDRSRRGGLNSVISLSVPSGEGPTRGVRSRGVGGAPIPARPRPKRRAKVQDVGFWDLASQVGELPRVIEALNASQRVFRFYDVQAAVPSGLVSRRERVVAWAQERLESRLPKRATEAIGNNVIFEDFAQRAKDVRKSLDLDYLIGIVPAMVAFDEGESIFWNYFAVEEEKISLVSTFGVYAYAQRAGQPFEVAVAGIALSNLLACFNPKVEFHEETRGCLFDFNRHRDSIVEMLREARVEPSCLALMAPRYREAAAAMTDALRGLGGRPKPKPPKKAALEPPAADKESSVGKLAARPAARVARK